MIETVFALRIGYSIAKKLAMDGAKVMLSSRKSANVEQAVKQLRSECEGVSVEGMVCHVGKDDHRKNLIKEVNTYLGTVTSRIFCFSRLCPSLASLT